MRAFGLRFAVVFSCLGLALFAILGVASASSKSTRLHVGEKVAHGHPQRGFPHSRSRRVANDGITTLGVGARGWEVQSTAPATEWTNGDGATQTPQAISSPGFDTSSWLPVKADSAGAAGTEVEALLQNGVCPDDQTAFPTGTINQSIEGADSIFYSNNLQNCFYGPNVPVASKIGADTNPLFNQPWWFRTDFKAHLAPGQDAELVINGVVGQADVWVNGTEVASQATVQGDYTTFSFDVTKLVHPGLNTVAFEMYPDNPSTMLTLDNVDWSQIAPDNNTGVQFPVQLHVADRLAVSNVYVEQNDAADMSSSALTVNADVTNHAAVPQTGTVTATITKPGGKGTITVSTQATVAAGSTQTVTFDPSSYRQLTIEHPQLWWPYQMGGQPLYELKASVAEGQHVDDVSPSSDFAIRSVTTMLTKPTDIAADGVRVMEVNGVPIQFRGGGWAENLFLHYSATDTANQIQVVKSLGVNGIRTEGKEMPQSWYDAMDKAGIMVDAGFQCCDKWAPSSRGTGVLTQEYHVLYLSALKIGERLRDHPSVVDYSWSDNPPTKEQELVSSQGFSQAGFQDPIVSSAEYNGAANYGSSGEKEGPYDWVPPSYWFDTTHGTYNGDDDDSTITNDGGAWGFDSEQGSGDSVPTIDSLDRFMSPSDQASLWECPGDHQFHTNYESSTGNCPQTGNGTGAPVIGSHQGYSFGTLDNLDTAIQNRYGAWNSLDQYVEEAQVQNYENTRAQFEAYADNWENGPTPATGTIYWQMNKGWPTLLWDLYNSDYDEAGAYFGAKKANESLHVMYSLGTGKVGVDNLTGASQQDLSVESRVYNLAGQVTSDQTASGLNLATQQVDASALTPKVPAATAPPAPAQTYFIELILRQHGQIVDRNVYWMSTQPDVIDWDSTLGNPQANNGSPLSQYADMTALQGLPSEQAKVTAATTAEPGNSGQDVTHLTITNPASNPSVALFLRADIRRGTAAGQPDSGDSEVLPVSYSDNDITLWPGQSETITATYAASGLKGAVPVVSVYGWNVGTGACGATQSCSGSAIDASAPSTAHAVAAEAAAEDQHGLQNLGLADGEVAPTEAVPGNGAGYHVTSQAATELSVSQTADSPTTPSTSFTQGDKNDTYNIVVKNVGTHSTDGTTPVTVSDTLAGDELGFVSITGTGWTCDSSQDPLITCTETGGSGDGPAVLQPGQSYPPLTLTVSVGSTAGFGDQGTYDGLHGTNAVTVSGGVQSDPSYSTAAATPIVGRADLTANFAQDGAFRQRDSADEYQVVVINQGGGATSGSASDPIKAVFAPGAGTTIAALYGSGWSCDMVSETCTRTDALAGENGEEPPITEQVAVSPTATSETSTSTEPSVIVSGGGDAVAAATVRASTTILAAATLAVTSSHSGSLAQGGTGSFTLTASTGAAPAGTTQGQVVVTDTLPPGVQATAMSGTGWTCPASLLATAPTCFRSDPTAPGTTHAPITLTVSVANDAPTGPVDNGVTASGGGAAAPAASSDPTTITGSNAAGSYQAPKAAVLTVSSSHQGTLSQGSDTGSYTLVVSNAAGAGATEGVVSVTDTLPPNVKADQLSGAGWTCSLDPVVLAPSPNTIWPQASCYRYDSLAAGASYPPITVAVSATNDAQPSVTNTATVTGGGSAQASSSDPTTITQLPELRVTAFTSVDGATYAPFAQGDGASAGDTYQVLATNAGYAPTHGPVSVTVDLPSGLQAANWTAPAGWSCQLASAISCQTSQAIAAGATVPLTLAVTVAGDAPQWVQPIIRVSGGGEVPTADLALDDQNSSVTNGGVFDDQTYITPAG
jgi:exo-1,4-beta-D-glucosaminidase